MATTTVIAAILMTMVLGGLIALMIFGDKIGEDDDS